jgi:SynChlorMet cassette radical SAM/SPASM protein ScmF
VSRPDQTYQRDASGQDAGADYSLDQLYFYLTEGCNLCCRHCWIAPKYQAVDASAARAARYAALDVGLFRSIVEQARPLGLSGVKLTGGEPLLHPQIDEILAFVRSEGLGLTVETNGVLCTPSLAERIAVCTSAFVSVSLDGADAATHEWVRGVKGCFEAALQGIRNLVAAGLKPQVIMSVMRGNVGQMEAVVRLAESLGAGSVKFNLVQPTARGKGMHDAGETLGLEELVNLGRWVEGPLAASTGLRLFYGHPPAFRPLSRMYGPNGDGCGVCGILGILGVLADGSYALCGIGTTVPELVFGHASTDRLVGVWQNTEVLNKLRQGLPERLGGICGDCLLKGVCLGSCIAQNYYSSGNLWAPFWYCEQAREKGLFPETRARALQTSHD